MGFLEEYETSEIIVNEIFNYLFELEKKQEGKKTIDYKKDYRLIWDSFKSKRNIDLNKDDINWWEFQAILEGLMLEGNNAIAKVVEYRTMKLPKQDKYNKQEIEFYKKMKAQYKLEDEQTSSQANNALTAFLMQKAGDKK